MQVYRRPVLQCSRAVTSDADFGIETSYRGYHAGRRHPATTADLLLAQATTGQVERTALAAATASADLVMHPERTHPQSQIAAGDGDEIIRPHPAVKDSTGDHQSCSLDFKGAINRHAEPGLAVTIIVRTSLTTSIILGAGLLLQLHTQCIHARRRYRRQRKGRPAFEQRVPAQCFKFTSYGDNPRGGNSINLADHDRATANTEQVDNRQVLAGLRHESVIGGHHQQYEIGGRQSAKCILDEALVTGHIDESDVGRGICKRQISKTNIDAETAPFFLGQSIGIDAGQCLHQTRFTVVDMPGGSNNHAPISRRSNCAANSSASSRQRQSSTNSPLWIRPITGTGNWRKARASRSSDSS